MNYIILDMEWNSAYSKVHGRFINEIIEIGAVKLDSSLREIGRFQAFVRSRLTKRLASRTKGLTHITNDDMRGGERLEKVLSDYAEFVGSDHLTLTWSNTDIYVLLDNIKSFMRLNTIPMLEKYADLQKFIQRRMKIDGNQISLSAAAELGGVSFDEIAAHRALGDCLVCAALLRKYFDEGELKRYICDTTRPDYYERLNFKPYYITDLHHPAIERTQLRFNCDVCGAPAKRVAKWSVRNNFLRADFACPQCKRRFNGRVRFKKTYDSVIVSKRICTADAERAAEAAAGDKRSELDVGGTKSAAHIN